MSRVPTRAERQTETRRRILDGAARVFARKGYHGASVGEVAETAGYTTGAVYSNFKGKEELFVELIDAHVAAHLEHVDRFDGAAVPGTLLEEMRESVRGVVRRLGDPAGAQRTAAGDRLTPREMMMLSLEFLLYAARENPGLHRSLGTRWRQIDEWTGETFGAVMDASAIGHPRLTPQELAIAHACFVEGLALRLLNDPGLLSPESAARLFDAMVLDAAGLSHAEDETASQ